LRLQKIKAYSKDDRVQYKYQITLPIETIDTLGWKEGSELKDSINGKSLVIDFVAEPSQRVRKEQEPRMTYEEFRDKIKNLLQYSDGMTWTEIRSKLNLDQVVPNNKWVHEMEKDIGLLRLKDPRGLIWRLRHV
jgi:bifunctional DNA-binding transcriptional regulator/antitoxin component of YhaV-PrlF toxin-antitoxin module